MRSSTLSRPGSVMLTVLFLAPGLLLAVSTAITHPYTDLSPRQTATSTAYAIRSENAASADMATPTATPLYSTYLGGSFGDEAHAIAVDSAGNPYVTGETDSLNFPTANPAQGTNSGNTDAFVTKLNASGTAFGYSTYLGDVHEDIGEAIAVDSSGNAYVAGSIRSGSDPSSADVLLAKLDPSGAVVYAISFGGSNSDIGRGIAMDSAGNVYVAGETLSTDFPVTTNGYQQTNLGGYDAFVAKVNPAGTSLLYSTLLGGSSNERGNGIAVDSAGNVYVTGSTQSSNFPVSQNAFQKTFNTGGFPIQDAFVAKLNTSASGAVSLVYSTFLGGDDTDAGQGITIDAAGNA